MGSGGHTKARCWTLLLTALTHKALLHAGNFRVANVLFVSHDYKQDKSTPRKENTQHIPPFTFVAFFAVRSWSCLIKSRVKTILYIKLLLLLNPLLMPCDISYGYLLRLNKKKVRLFNNPLLCEMTGQFFGPYYVSLTLIICICRYRVRSDASMKDYYLGTSYFSQLINPLIDLVQNY